MTLAKLGIGALVFLACLLWLTLVATVATLNSSDPAGNALSYSYAMLMTVALWILLGALMLVAAMAGAIPGWVGLSALIVVPLSCAATMASVHLLRGPLETLDKWPIVVPILAPLLILTYVLWTYLPALRSAVPAGVANGATWGALLVLALAPWPFLRSRGAARRQAQDAYRVEQANEAERERQGNLARFQQLTPDSPLSEWLEFTTGGNELRDSAFAGIRTLARRQADAEEMIARDVDLPMMELPHLDLAVTPQFCDIAREFLRRDAESFRPTVGDSARGAVWSFRIDRHLRTLHWLNAHECDCDAAVSAYETTARLYPDSPERTLFLRKLAELRRQRT